MRQEGIMKAIDTGRYAPRRVAPYIQRLIRLSLHHPFLALLSFFTLSLTIGVNLFHFLTHGDLGRWYYNYALIVTPDSLVRFIPKGGFGPPTDPPRWIPEIYGSRWMGDWEVPPLSRPVWKQVQQADEPGTGAGRQGDDGLSLAELAEQQLLDDMGDLPPSGSGDKARRYDSAITSRAGKKEYRAENTPHPHALSRQLSSPAIIKFHVFSTAVSEKSRIKRDLIRRLSPMYQIPPAYRHLIDVKFVLGYNYLDTWGPPLNETMESKIREEEREYGDILRLPDLWRGENLRDGKILQWIRDVGEGKDGRNAWYLFKVDDDAVVNLPKLLDLLLSLDIHQPTYLGTSLARWPSYHNHFTGFLTGFNYGLLKTLSQGISKMPEKEVQAAWDDDVLTGELMYSLPSAPSCQGRNTTECNPHTVPPYGWMPLPKNPDPRTDLNRYDFERRAGDPAWFATKGDLAMHGWWFKFPEYWEKEWRRSCKGRMWKPPAWLEQFADKSV